MNITQVKVFPVGEEKLKAFVSVVFDHCFMVNDIKVIQGRDGLFLSMPSRRKRSGEFKDVAHPLNNSMRRTLEERVLREYRGVVEDETPRRPDREDGDDEAPATDPFGVAALGATGHGSPEVAAPLAAASPAETEVESDRDEGDSEGLRKPTLEEVRERHLQDSFWSVS